MPNILKYARWGLLVLAYCISYMIPRSKNIWIFGSWAGQKFADNSKYLFLYTVRNHPEIRAIWLTHSRKVAQKLSEEGYEVYEAFSVKGFLFSMRAGRVIVSSLIGEVNEYVLGRAKKIQLWHGTALKRIRYDDEIHFVPAISSDYKNANNLRTLIIRPGSMISKVRFSDFDVFIAASEESRQKLSSAFSVKTDMVYVTGQPRNDALLGADWLSPDEDDYLANIKGQVSYQYVFTYLPTFRDTHLGNPDLLERYNFDTYSIQQILERLNAILIMKGHFADKQLNLPTPEGVLKRIYSPSDEELPDVYPVLKHTDILITDYSGVYFDYLLLNRPIIFAPFDIHEYVEKDRKLYYDYNEVTPGPKAKDWREVFRLIEEVLEKDEWKQQREHTCDIFNNFRDCRSSERVFKLLQQVLG